jgi:hypothetical protein
MEHVSAVESERKKRRREGGKLVNPLNASTPYTDETTDEPVADTLTLTTPLTEAAYDEEPLYAVRK